MDAEKLIELVRKHPVLYDLTHKKYIDSSLKAVIWNDIGRELGVNGNVCRARWNNIRDNYRKSIQKNLNRSEQGHKSIKPYRYHEQLAFMKKYFGERKNPETASDQDNDEEPTVASRKRRKSARSETTSANVLEYILHQNETLPQSVDTFLASLGPTLKALHPCDWFDAKSELFDVVKKYEAKLLRQQFLSISQPTESSFSVLQNTSSTSVKGNESLDVMQDNGSDSDVQDPLEKQESY